MYRFEFNPNDKLSKVGQIVRSITMDIEKGVLPKDTRLPSINEFSDYCSIARDTVERAYRELKKEGYIVSVAARGYFVAGKKDHKIKVLLLFNKLSSYKKLIYDAFVRTLGEKARIDLQVYHYDPRLLGDLIRENLGQYHYYAVMPHFFQGTRQEEYQGVLEMIPPGQLLLLDKNLPGLTECSMAVYQDFRQDIYEALLHGRDLMEKYQGLTIIFPRHSNHPKEIIEGVLQFCVEHKKKFRLSSAVLEQPLEKGTAYLVISESDLATLIKESRKAGLQAGKEVGIISFNETVLKELLDITVVTTDFDGMGVEAAHLILDRRQEQKRNPFRMIRRNSL